MDNINKEMQFLIYRSDEDDVSVNALIRDETIWITQMGMAKIFDCSTDNIGLHLKNIYADNELDKNSTTEEFSVVRTEGNRQVVRTVTHYNLDAIISVGYRVNSKKATKFRIWATKTLKEYIQKGFVLDDERLKQGEQVFGKDYFRELLERVRSIRASERRIWQQITDIFAECSIDYDKDSLITQRFYAMVQNKFHYAITGQTAAEIVYNSADRSKDNMGLTTWKNSPDGRILKSDVSVAKNYLDDKQIRQLERAVTGYFDYIEDLIVCHEICHVLLFWIGFTPVSTRAFGDTEIEPFRSVEWQAKALTGEVMIPYEASKGMTSKAIVEKYHVTKKSADYRVKQDKKKR